MSANCHSMGAGYGNGKRFSAANVVAMTKPHTESDNAPRRNLSEQEAADYLGVLSVRTLQDWRRKRTGPVYLRLGRRIAYRVSDLDDFLRAARIAPKACNGEPSA